MLNCPIDFVFSDNRIEHKHEGAYLPQSNGSKLLILGC